MVGTEVQRQADNGPLLKPQPVIYKHVMALYGRKGDDRIMSTNGAKSRRSMLAVLPGLALLFAGAAARAAGTTQSAAKYQPVPKGKSQCSNCTYYIPASKNGGTATCKIVAGSVSPNGWCKYYAAK